MDVVVHDAFSLKTKRKRNANQISRLRKKTEKKKCLIWIWYLYLSLLEALEIVQNSVANIFPEVSKSNRNHFRFYLSWEEWELVHWHDFNSAVSDESSSE